MRLWHKDMISVLPRQQLLSQWRELCSIFVKQDNHILINFVYDYPFEHLRSYSNLVKQEFVNRGYKISESALEKESSFYFWNKVSDNEICFDNVFSSKMNDKYLRQCLFNLEEKHDCMAIDKYEWKLIHEKYSNVIEE